MRGAGGSRGQEGRTAGGGVAGPPLTTLSLQELSKREVVAVGHLEVPAELAGLLRAVAGTSVLQVWWEWAQVGRGARHLVPSSLHRP